MKSQCTPEMLLCCRLGRVIATLGAARIFLWWALILPISIGKFAEVRHRFPIWNGCDSSRFQLLTPWAEFRELSRDCGVRTAERAAIERGLISVLSDTRGGRFGHFPDE